MPERELRDLVRAHLTPQRLAERAQIILLAAAGLGVEETAQRLGIWRKTVGHRRGNGINVFRVDPVSGGWTPLQTVGGLENPALFTLPRTQPGCTACMAGAIC